MSKKEKSLRNKIEQEENYVAFLKKRLDSENFKTAVSESEYKDTKKKYEKSKLKLKFLLDDEKTSGK